MPAASLAAPSPPPAILLTQPRQFLTWLWCKGCGDGLAAVFSDGARTFLLIGPIQVFHANLPCRCGKVRAFVSVRLPRPRKA